MLKDNLVFALLWKRQNASLVKGVSPWRSCSELCKHGTMIRDYVRLSMAHWFVPCTSYMHDGAVLSLTILMLY